MKKKISNQVPLNEEMDVAMGKMLPNMVRAAVKLTELVVNNRVNNGEKLEDKDIYEIYGEAFKRSLPDLYDENNLFG